MQHIPIGLIVNWVSNE